MDFAIDFNPAAFKHSVSETDKTPAEIISEMVHERIAATL